jgi:hypothetical protein
MQNAVLSGEIEGGINGLPIADYMGNLANLSRDELYDIVVRILKENQMAVGVIKKFFGQTNADQGNEREVTVGQNIGQSNSRELNSRQSNSREINGWQDNGQNKDQTADQANNRELSDNEINKRISNVFITIGIPPHIKGYQYLRCAIRICIKKTEIISFITKCLYPDVAKEFNTTPSKVERAIRHAIEVCWNRGKIDAINNFFGSTIFTKYDRPTNGEFIALVADKLLLEGV